RRSGFPVLPRNTYNDDLVPGGGFVRRMSYPDAEKASNADNYKAAVASMGGDGLTQRVFWDKP
ncbi:MAG: SusD/RagB family nutrient-binding outer membrane lipoprotein, partial [Bacteroidota bacterium]